MQWRALAVLLVAGAAVAGGLFAWVGTSHRTGKSTASRCGEPLPVPLTAAAEATLAAYGGRIEYEHERASDGTRRETWTDPRTGRSRSVSLDRLGQVTDVDGETWHGAVETSLTVAYADRTWTIDSTTFPRRYASVRNDAAAVSRLIRNEITSGFAVVVGRATFRGRETLRLHMMVRIPRTLLTPAALGLPKGMPVPTLLRRRLVIQSDTWIDPNTYLPVRVRTSQIRGWTMDDDAWLPRTVANLGKTRVAIPHGFKQEQQSQQSVGLTSTGVSATPSPFVRCR